MTQIQVTANTQKIVVDPVTSKIQVFGFVGPPGPPGAINSDISAIVTLTQSEFNNIVPDPLTLYIIT
jgi:hypothetical protein